jgi:hypothetical protein
VKSSEPKASKTASRLQAKNRATFFQKQHGEASGPEKNTTHSDIQTKHKSSPFFTEGGSLMQAQLEVHPSDDAYEKEADAMADRVMLHSGNSATDPPNESHNGSQIQTSPLYKTISRVQRQRAFESPTVLELNTSDLAPSDEMPLQRKTKPDHIQLKSDGAADSAPAGMDTALNSAKGRGTPLPDETRSKMESGFGTDFSQVNIHTDQEAEQMNKQIGARAFTHGNDVYFNSGEYKPNTTEGDHLLAHELTHTVQQGGSVRRKSNTIQKITKPKKTDIYKATIPLMTAATQDRAKKPEFKTFPGEIVTDGNGNVKIYLELLKAKYYLIPGDLNFLKSQGDILIKKPRQERNSEQMKIWKENLIPKVKDNLKKKGKKPIDETTIYALKQTVKTSKPAIYGTVSQLANEIVVPPWNKSGTGGLYDIEHKLDYQIAQSLADNIDNLILLDRKKNQELGTSIETSINTHLETILKHYVDYFSGITSNPKTTKNKFNIYVRGDLDYQKGSLDADEFYIKSDVEGAPLLKNVELDDEAIPKGKFLLISSDQRAAYLLPMTEQEQDVGSFKLKVKLNAKKDEVVKVTLTPIKPHDPKDVIDSGVKQPEDTPIEEDPKKLRVYTLKTDKRKLGRALKSLIGGVKGFSPIVMDDPELDGLNIKIKGKVISTISFLKDVDITFGYDNGDFYIKAEVPLTKLAANIPKPFLVTSSSVSIEASSKQGIVLAGNARFKIEKFGEGEISASAGKSIAFDGNFNFDSKLFNPAMVKVGYANGKWSIEGNIGIQAGAVKGVKEAALHVKYADNALSADGNAKLDVPGIDSIKLSASYSEGGGFKFVATADLKKMPGIKSGSVTISILSKGDGPIILGFGGTAEPDFPGVPGLNTVLTVFYEDGVFDMRAKVGYKKGKFDGTIEVGVTNKSVDEKGLPQGDPKKGGETVVFGFGSLTVDLFKGSKGTISVRLTPDKQLLVSGSFSVKNLKPFGDGVNIHKKIVEFPTIKIPLVGVPGVSIFFSIGGGAYFNFTWDPLILKDLTISFKETDINEIETAQVDIHGEVASKAVAEAYMEITASLGAQVLIAEIKGSLSGDAGIGVEAEAGGILDASWNNEKGLQLKEINVFVAVNPKAFFRLKGSVSVDLDLWVTTINLYYKEWILAEGAADLSGLSLKVDFPLKFDENGDLIRPEFEQLHIEKPDFSGDQGKEALDSGINSGAKKERKLAKEKLRAQIADDMRGSRKDDDFSPTEYAEKMQKKYKEDEEMKAFIMDSVEEEVKIQEYEEFDQLKNDLRKSELPVSDKVGKAMVFKLFRARISPADYDAFITELYQAEQQKQEAARNQASLGQPAPTT